MKKIIFVMSLFIILCGTILGISYSKNVASQETIAKKLIRFHVIANSDTNEDQSLKLKVRDEVLNYIEPKLKNASSIDQSRKIIKENDGVIKEITKKVIKENGYDYKVETKLFYDNFPVKSYGDITLPEGNYEAYKVIIGNGEGHNWWCVMFPPLCFTDITRGEISNKENEKQMKRVLTKEEYELVNNSDNNIIEEDKIIFKFKIIEVAKTIYKKIQKN